MRTFLLALVLALAGLPAAAQECSHRLFVSGYFSNNVHVYDACTGEFQRVLPCMTLASAVSVTPWRGA